MKQNQLFIDSLSDAITDLVNQCGGVKKMGSLLWPEKTVRDAGSQLLNCLNPDHAQKLSLEQIDFLFDVARKETVHVVPQYIGNRYGYKVLPVEPEDEKAELQRKFIKAQESMSAITSRLEQLA